MRLKLVLSFFVIVISIFSSSAQNNPPSISSSQAGDYCPGNMIPIATNVSITDPDIGDTTLDVVVVQISQGYSIGQDFLALNVVQPNITASWNAAQGELTLSGNATFAEYEMAIEAVVFQTSQTNFADDKFFSINIGNANYLPSTGHYYFYVSDVGITWNQAKVAAEGQTFFGLQGYLATITSAEESQLAGEQSPGTGWIGATDEEIEGTWKWVTGPEAGTVIWIGVANGTAQNGEFNFWNTAEPNNFNGNEDYAHITDPSIGQPGSWNDLPNAGDAVGSPYHPQGYLVEFGGMPGDPIINLSASTTIIMPRIIQADDVTVCENDTVNISVTSNTDSVLWFDSATSSTPIFSGFNYSPTIIATTNYWVIPVFNGCVTGVRTQITVNINPQPIALDVSIRQCEDDIMDGITNFNLNTASSEITNGNTNGMVITFYSDIALVDEINGDSYTNFSNPQTVYALVTDNNTNCTNTSEVTIEVSTDSLNDAILLICDDASNDGVGLFNLSDASTQILAGLPQDVQLEFYLSLEDALLQNNILNTNYTNETPNTQILYVRGDQNDNCYGISQLELSINNAPETISNSETYYCLNSFPNLINLSSGVIGNPNNYSYNWSTGDTSENISINTIGNFNVTITSNTTGCSVTRNISVLPSNIATIENIDVQDVSQNNTITVSVMGEGNYQYAIDNIAGPYQDSNVFNYVTADVHTVYIKDILNNCGIVSQEISVIGYPNYFTPNGDDINETWQVKGLSNNFSGVFVVNIYDRFGKLIYTLKDKNDSWDGTYNGMRMPTSDYWFTVFIGRGKNFKGHFTLKR